jgi:hypothetical protein
MSKTRKQELLEDINELLGYFEKSTKTETMAAQLGLLMGWMSRLASQDYTVKQELEARLVDARKNHSSSAGTSKPLGRRP